MVFSFLSLANCYPKWPGSVRARAVIRIRKHHFGIFLLSEIVARKDFLISANREPPFEEGRLEVRVREGHRRQGVNSPHFMEC